MSIERAKKRIKKMMNTHSHLGEFFWGGLRNALDILEEESVSPCDKCEHWIELETMGVKEMTCSLTNNYSELQEWCVHNKEELENLFKEKK